MIDTNGARVLPAVHIRPSASDRTALWKHAGLQRDAAGLQTLLSETHPLVSLIARSALAREETRGAHIRSDFPETKPTLDYHHSIVRTTDPEVRFERW
jgi:L-aspartate oxidase